MQTKIFKWRSIAKNCLLVMIIGAAMLLVCNVGKAQVAGTVINRSAHTNSPGTVSMGPEPGNAHSTNHAD